jgi:putative isomerase
LFALTPGNEVQIVAGFDGLVPFASVDGAINQADQDYATRRIAASGDWGDFAGAIADNLNNTRLYSSATHRVAHTVSRTFSQTNPDYPVFFCWDSFFTGLLASLEDPVTGEDTVRGILSFQTAEGIVPNFGGWGSAGNSSNDRSQPPVGSMAIWKMYQRWHDLAFLAEVYPKLVKWHDWWPTARDGNKNGLLEWGTSTGSFQNAQYETGWDDNVEYADGSMVGNNMNVDAVDLSSLWAMDAEYLTAIATALGNTSDAARFQADHDNMATLINNLLWNDQLGIYCSRPWSPVNGNVFFTRLTPMNFYPLIAGVPDATRAAAVLQVMTSAKFWGGGADAAGANGDLILPTVAYDDPVWPQQTYWHGTIWGPVNYLVFQGVKRYATPEIQAEFARRSVSLFMTNWTEQGTCCENFLSTTGFVGGNPHYTWGALLNLIGIEAAADASAFDPEATPVPGKGFTSTFNLVNIPFGGRLYDIQVSDGAATVSGSK